MAELLIASKNKKKTLELKEILSELPIQVLSLLDLPDAPDVVEDGNSFFENADKKALEIAQWSGKLTLSDDSGLCVEALKGAPGIYSARYSEEGTDYSNCIKLLSEMENIPDDQRKAAFFCVISLADSKGVIAHFEGKCEGIIARNLVGDQGFGYDPIFTEVISGKRFAELSKENKNRISHRAKALRSFRAFMSHYITQA